MSCFRLCPLVTEPKLTILRRITRLMGESFRLHAQALIGFVDDIAASSSVSTPSMTSQGADEDSVY